ncbi:reverse transcriptase/maturase family protein [Photobacterium sp. GSS17]|uniref:reverse transcriptase/maturase family protein n=1 Tax=Photobacterium sp. GSS17 TaxID=3020715 RepID=UPI0023604299|nr:reverse transcriptase/maturase family protein [Photobacterium sp. GSS17]
MDLKPYLIFRRTFNKGHLKNIYEENIKNSGAIGHDGINHDIFENKIDSEVDVIIRKTINKTYSFTQYKEKLVLKGANKNPRQISIPSIRDRITLKYISNFLQSVFDDVINQEIPQVKIEKVKAELSRNRYDSFVKVDIKSFYPSINHDILKRKLNKRVRKAEFIYLIEKAIKTQTLPSPNKNALENETGVPQGLSISNFLAEIYLADFDRESFSDDFFFCRYVDDILILCKEGEIEEIYNKVKQSLSLLGLNTHDFGVDDKCEYGKLDKGFTYLGYTFKSNDVSVRKASVTKIESSIAKILTTFKYRQKKADLIKSKVKREIETEKNLKILKWRLDLRITGCIYNNTKRGWVFYFSQINDLIVFRELDFTVNKLLKRFNLDGKITPKKFIKTYHESKIKEKNKYKYICNFDKFSIAEKRKSLELYLGVKSVAKIPDDKVDKLFGMKISSIIKELELDVGEVS